MEDKKLTHWRRLVNPNYIGAYSLDPGEKRTVKIEKVVKEVVIGEGGKKDECVVAYLKNEKPFIINKTNMKTITKIYGTPYIEEWVGRSVTVFATPVKGKAGEIVEALRIVEEKPPLPELTPDHPRWSDAVKAAKAKQITPAQIKSNYSVTEPNLKTLFNETV